MHSNQSHLEVLELACVVAYRSVGGRVEFYLTRSIDENSWEFPEVACVNHHVEKTALAVADAMAELGLLGRLAAGGPIGEFRYSRGDHARNVTAYLFHVLDDAVLAKRSHGRWCMAEEGRRRIRRKPMRRLLDTALKIIGGNSTLSPAAGGLTA